ncbi:MAG TPA: hypothetical protein VF195_06935 [Actinomycetota bacterium]
MSRNRTRKSVPIIASDRPSAVTENCGEEHPSGQGGPGRAKVRTIARSPVTSHAISVLSSPPLTNVRPPCVNAAARSPLL